MSNAAIQYASVPERGRNGMGMAGFIVSLVGLVIFGGILCPVGLILSLVGLRKPPRGFAIAGTVIGVVGSMVGVMVGLMIVGLLVGAAMLKKEVVTRKALANAHIMIRSYESDHGGALPDDADGQAIVGTEQDGWKHPLRYRKLGERFIIQSAGRDGRFDTGDDERETWAAGE